MWHHLLINNKIETGLVSEKIMKDLQSFMLLAKNPNLCIFSRFDKITRETHIYFAPGTESIAQNHGAQSCKAPSQDEVGKVFAGNVTEAIIDSFFR